MVFFLEKEAKIKYILQYIKQPQIPHNPLTNLPCKIYNTEPAIKQDHMMIIQKGMKMKAVVQMLNVRILFYKFCFC